MSGRYRNVISLGAGCATAYHIHRFTSQREANFFDWLATPVPALISLLKTDLRALFRHADDFVPQRAPRSIYFAARHRELGIVSYHDFPEELALAALPAVAEKYAFLADRWEKAMKDSNAILFVRHLASREESIDIRDTLRACYPSLEFKLLVIEERREPSEPWDLPDVINATILPTPFELIDRGVAGSSVWQGDTEGWISAFKLAGALPESYGTLLTSASDNVRQPRPASGVPR